MLQLRRGMTRFLVLASLLSGCRETFPPKIEVCIGDGFGGADCVEADGAKLYKAPSTLKTYWMTNSSDIANFSSWCYNVPNSSVEIQMRSIAKDITVK